MMRVGKAAKVEVLRTEVRISDVEQRLVREQTVLEIQRRALITLMGVDGGGGPAQIQGDLKMNRNVPDLNGALAMAYAERSDYKAAKASVDALGWKVAAARGGPVAVAIPGRNIRNTSCSRSHGQWRGIHRQADRQQSSSS